MTDHTKLAKWMRFGRNVALFEEYVRAMAALLHTTPEAIVEEIAEGQNLIGDKPHSRYLMLPSETFLYTLPLVKASRDAPDALLAFNGLSVEPFYRAFRSWADELLPDPDRTAYMHIDRHGDLDAVPLLSRSILPLLTVEEAQELVDGTEWDEIGRAAADLDLGADDLGALRRGGASRGELIRAIADHGLDNRFRYFFLMALHSRFGDYCKSDELNAAASGVPVDRVIAWVKARNAGLTYPLDADDVALLEDGVRKLGGNGGRLNGFERSGLHKYIITFGDIRKAAALKHSMQHAARPVLNVLLRNTAFARRLTDSTGRTRTVLQIDQTTTSGLSFLVWELVVRAFRHDAAGQFVTITQHTSDSADAVSRHGFIDEVCTSGIWPQENNLEDYDGLFLDADGTGARYRTFVDLLVHLNDKHRGPGAAGEIETLNRDIDAFVRSRDHFFDFIDAARTLRFDRRVIKRQAVKAALRRGDELESALLKKYYLVGASAFEEDFIGSYLLRDSLVQLDSPEFLDIVPPGIRDRDQGVRYLDQAVLVEQLACRAQARRKRCTALRDHLLTHTAWGALVRDYLDGRVPFAELERNFYDGNCAAAAW
jgi:hypothetical protein